MTQSSKTPHPARSARDPLPQGERVKQLWLAATVAAIACGTMPLALAEIPLDQRRSGYEQMSPATKAMQDDDTSNPATLSVLDGEALWKRKVGESNKTCADCHGDATQSKHNAQAHR